MNIKHIFLAFVLSILLPISTANVFAATGDATFDAPGTYTYTVPAGVDELYIKVWGAGGGGGGLVENTCTGGVFGLFENCSNRPGVGGAGGGYAEAQIDVTAGETFTVVVGAGGFGTGANDTTYASYTSSPTNTSSSAEASIVTSQSTGKYIGAGGGATGFNTIYLGVGQTPPDEYIIGSLSGKGAGQAVNGTGAGRVGRIRSWCGDGQGNYGSGCLVVPTGGNGFGTYSGITTLQGSNPPMPIPFPLLPSFNVAGGAGANGGAGGALDQAGTAPGGGAGPSTVLRRGGAGKVVIQVGEPVASGNFDFSLSNGGDVVTTPGGVVTNLVTGTLTQGTPRLTNLSVTSITNSSGASVLNTSNGFTVSNAPFSNSAIIPTQGSVVRLDATPTTPAGVYTVTVSADTPAQTSTTVTTATTGTIYYCKSVYTSLSGANLAFGRGETFACSDTQTFDPLKVPGAMDFINWDDVSYCSGGCLEPYYNTWVYQSWLTNLRANFADAACGSKKWTLYPYGYNPYVRTTGFICTGTSSTTTTTTEPSVHKTTTFTITIDTYNLVAEKGADVCSATDAYTRLTWKRDPSALSYRLYKKQGAGAETYVTVPQPSSGTTVTYYDPDSNFSNNTGLTVGDLYTYRVVANIGGVLQGSSPSASAFPSSVLPSGSCTMTYTVGGGDVTIQQGGSLSINIPLALTSGATQSVSVQYTPAVSGITFTPALPGCSSVPCTATTLITVGSAVPVGTYTYAVGARSSGNILASNTLIVRVTGNSRPYPVKSLSITGPCSGDGVVNGPSVITYTSDSPADPDGDAVTYEYQIDYGSGYGTGVSNGTAKYFSLTWTTAGAVKVRVRAVDSKGATSPWVEQGLTVRDNCGTSQTLITECISGFNAITNEAVWFASTTGGKAPYTYSWNNSTFDSLTSTKSHISTPGGTANGPTLMVKDSANSKAAAFPACTSITRPSDNNTPLNYTIDGGTVKVYIGETASTTVKIASTDGLSRPVTITPDGQVINTSSGGAVSYITFSPTTTFTCTTIIPDCTKEIGITVNPVTGRTGTFTIGFDGTASTGETAHGEITVIVERKQPPVSTTLNLTLTDGPTACNLSTIIATWNVDTNPSVTGYNLYRSQAGGPKVLMNTAGPIAQKASGTITYSDTAVAPGVSYNYDLSEIISGLESSRSTYSIRTAPTPNAASCPSLFSFAVYGDDYTALPGQTINASAHVRLSLGTSKAVNLSLNPVVSGVTLGTPVAVHKDTSFMSRITAAVSSFLGIAHAAEPYITVSFAGAASCTSIPCDVPITVKVSPSASENEYIIPVTAKTTDNSSTATGSIKVVVSNTPPPTPTTSTTVTLSDGMADCVNSSLTVVWTKDLNATGYNVYRAQANQSFASRINTSPFAQPSGATRSYTDLNLIPGVTYTYYVRSIIGGVESNPSPSVTRTAPTVPMGPGSCSFSMNVTGDGIFMKAGEEKITQAHILLNIGSNTATTLKIGTVAVNSYVSQGSSIKSDLARTLNELFALGPIKLNAAGTVTASFVTNGKCISLPCHINIKITSAADALAGTYTFPLTASTDGPIPGVGIVSASGSLPVQIQQSLTPGCPPNCSQPTTGTPFVLGINATPVTVVAGQSTSSLVSIFTVSPTGVDKASSALIQAARFTTANGSATVTSVKAIPTTFTCNHSIPTCVQNITITTDANTTPGTYLIPVTAKVIGSNETADINIQVTVTADVVNSESSPDLEARVFYPSGAATPAVDWRADPSISPRRSAYLAPVVVDVETRRVTKSATDFDSCYTKTKNNTANWVQGSEIAPVNPSLVFVKKTLTIVGADELYVYCTINKTKEVKTAKITISPINDPVIKEF